MNMLCSVIYAVILIDEIKRAPVSLKKKTEELPWTVCNLEAERIFYFKTPHVHAQPTPHRETYN